MKKVIYLSIMFLMISLTISAQASGGQITRKKANATTTTAAPKKTSKPHSSGQSNKSSGTTSGKPVRSLPIRRVNGIEAVDLGLSVQWATCNVGASKPEESGNHYAWGETKTKSDYSWATYFDVANTGLKEGLYGYTRESFKKYSYLDRHLSTEDDVASMTWGSSWRIPTNKEYQELWDLPHKWEVLNGVHGIRFTSANGNSIFLPAVGALKDDSVILNDTDGVYWTSEIYQDDHDTSEHAYAWWVNSKLGGWDSVDRCYGLSIRPVTNK